MTVRVGVVGPDDPDLFADNIASALESSGIATIRLGGALPAGRARSINAVVDLAARASTRATLLFQQRLVRSAESFGCQIVISVDARLEPETVSQLRRRGSKVALWYPDHVANIGRQLMLRAPYDRLYFKEPQLVERLNALLELPVSYLPEACNPIWHRPEGRGSTEPYLAVVGNLYPSRVRLLDRLLAHNIPLRLHSGARPAWLDGFAAGRLPVHGEVRGAEKARIFRQAAGVLNNLHPAELLGVNCRLFEAAGSGAAVLCEDRPALRDLFERDTELFTFSTFDELLMAARLVLADQATAEERGDAAARRAHSEHTYSHRLQTILSDLA